MGFGMLGVVMVVYEYVDFMVLYIFLYGMFEMICIFVVVVVGLYVFWVWVVLG